MAVALTVALMLSACGPGDRGAAPSPPAGVGGTLVRGLGAEPGTLDPRNAEDNAALAIAADLYEGLTRETAGGDVEPGAAETWTVSDDGLDYVFRLRDGLRWSDGGPLTAHDFESGLRRLLLPTSLSPSAPLFAAIRDVAALDDRTLRIRLDRPVPYLPTLLALPAAAPQPAAPGEGTTTLTNGPFVLSARVAGERIDLARNPYYWDSAAISIGAVTYRLLTDLGTELNFYRAGQLDITSEVPNALVQQLRAERPAELRIAPYLSTYSYAVNLRRLTDANARRALAMAVDRRRITELVTGAGERSAYGWVPDGIPGYLPARFSWQDVSRPDIERRARDSWNLARAHGGAPARIKLCTDSSANHRRTAIALADFWRSVLGVDVVIEEFEWTVYLDRRRAPGDCDLVRLGWSADYIEPEAFAEVFESGHPQNTLGYRSARYDALLARSRSARSREERMATLRLAEAQLLEDVPVIPVFFRVSKRLVKPYVTGFQANPLGHLASRNLRLLPH